MLQKLIFHNSRIHKHSGYILQMWRKFYPKSLSLIVTILQLKKIIFHTVFSIMPIQNMEDVLFHHF